MYIYMLNGEQLIDSVFYPLYYRYVPFELRSEWHKVYINYATEYYENMKRNQISPQIKIDFLNEERNSLSLLDLKNNKFKKNIPRIIPMFDSDKEYTEKVKKSLTESTEKISRFINSRQKELNLKFKKNSIPIRNSIEHFNNDKISNTNSYMYLIFFILLIFILYKFNN